MKIKLIEAVSLHNVVSQLSVNGLSDDKEKIALIRLSVDLKKYRQQWDDIVETAKTMASDSANTLINKEAVTEIEIADDRLISVESAEALAVSNSGNLPVGALGYILDYLTKQ